MVMSQRHSGDSMSGRQGDGHTDRGDTMSGRHDGSEGQWRYSEKLLSRQRQ